MGAGAPCPDCNLVLISLDTLGADHVGAYGYGKPTTPSIDALAARSVLFEDAVSQSAWTRPAHASMFTGLHPNQHGIASQGESIALSEEVPTLTTVLREHGYATAAFTGGANMQPRYGLGRGFDLYHAKSEHMRENVAPALAWIDAAKQPFFVFLHGYEPHRPYRSDPVDRAKLGLADPPRDFKERCEQGPPPADREPYVGEYDGAVRRGDRAVGAFLRGLEERGLLDRTVVIFTSDHGEELFEHGGCYHVETLYGEVLRVPLLVRAPGVEPKRVEGIVAASVAVAPTALELLGFEKSPLPGPSLAGSILGEDSPAALFVVSETGSAARGMVRSLTAGDEKLVHWVNRDRFEVYDLRSDPAEQRPLAEADREEKMKKQLADWIAAHPRVAEPKQIQPPSRALRKKLRRLGYVE